MINLTIPQQNIWNLQRYYEGTSITNNCGAIFFDKKCDHKLLSQAINKLIELQAGMRLRFSEEDGEAVQYVSDYRSESIRSEYFANRDDFENYAKRDAQTPFELIDSVMYRFTIFDMEEKTGVLLCANHLISDAWSISKMADEIYKWYNALDTRIILEEKRYDYTTFVGAEQKYLNSVRYEKDKLFWDRQYLDRPEICCIKPKTPTATSPKSKRYTVALADRVSRLIDTFCLEENISQAVLFETAVMIYLSRINPDISSVSIGIPVLNRSTANEKNTIGMCISTVPLCVTVSNDDSAVKLCQKVAEQQFRVFRHQKYPYGHLLHTLHEKFGFSGNLYDVVVSFQNAKTNTGAKTEWIPNGYCESAIEFHIDNRDNNDFYTLNIDYQTELFRRDDEIKFLFDRILLILEQIVSEPDIRIGELEILSRQEYEKVVYEFNATAVTYPREKCVHTIFEEQVMLNPDGIAVIDDYESWTYKELNEQANRIANTLIRSNVHIGDIIALALPKRFQLIAAMLGVMKCGAAYLPMDLAYPPNRIASILEDCKAKVFLNPDNIDAFMRNSCADNPQISVTSEDVCYCIYTSGSTGKPKGVLIRHRNLVNFCQINAKNAYQQHVISKNDSIISMFNSCFDGFGVDYALFLLNGKTVILTEQAINADVQKHLSSKYCVGAVQSTPSIVQVLCAEPSYQDVLEKTNTVMLAAENLPKNLCHHIKSQSSAAIYNGYGPSETTIGVSFGEITDCDDIHIGSPGANTQMYILDKEMRPLPIGVAGELCISGDCVGLGYLNRPELTKEKFVPNPFVSGAVMYRTGDLACWRTDGNIAYLGRMDTQVKIRGLRIELGEIENIINSFDGIELAAAADKQDENGRKYLVGYYTAHREIDERELRHHLSSMLPKYMVPNYLIKMDTIPLTASGKIDRKNLPVPSLSEQEHNYIAPETATEVKIAAMWEELLHATEVGKNDDFFDLGGDSLVAIHLLTKLETVFHVEITVKDIIENSELEQLSLFIDNAQCYIESIPCTDTTKYNLLPQQMAIYTACAKDQDSLVYNMPSRIALPASVDRKKLFSCIQRLPEIHPELKTRIYIEEGTPTAVIDDNAKIVVEECKTWKEFVRPFDLSNAPLIRFGFTEDSLLFDMHHIISDGESLNVILRDLAMMYMGKDPATPGVHYADYAKYFHSADFAEHKAFFKEMLKYDFEPMQLPERKDKNCDRGISRFYQIDQQTFEMGRKIARAHKLTDTMLFLSAFGILLSKYTGRTDVLSSITLTNRGHRETEYVTGMFVNTLPIVLSTQGTTTEYLNKVRNLVLNLFKYQEIPFLSVAEAVGMRDKNVVNTSFVYQADGEKVLALEDAVLQTEWIDTHTSKFDLSFELTPNQNGCLVRIEYNCGKYEPELIDRLFDGYAQVIGQLDKEYIADITAMSPAEYQKAVYDFNNTDVPFDREKCVHELFAEQVKDTPDKIALVFEKQSFTYRQLDEMSNSLAHYLRSNGIAPGTIVPIISKRSWHVIVAMLGILKAGGAYMPVDPTYPKDRIDYMFETAQCSLALTYGYAEKLDIEAISLENFDFDADITPISNLNSSEDLCYIIFTSGSTGKPKGVAIAHRNVHNFCISNASVFHSAFCLKSKYVLAISSFAFDITLQEIWLPLLNGVAILMANDTESLDGTQIAELTKPYSDLSLIITPSKLAHFMTNKDFTSSLERYSVIMCGAETFPEHLFDNLRKLTTAMILNGYGPTEITCGSSYQKVIDKQNITIGTPIANTQYYVLDSNKKPLPIGVAGELCIAGDGVGKGYLNRPELTAERFVPNPFIPGTTMYCTGDLARWRADGEIDYLGRIDNQVKIRGLRIELGEIESVMSQFDGIQLAAVTDKKEETGRQYLVGYYTAESEINEKDLRHHLSAKLPKYMVPNYFVHLDEIPMTASGKTDRKNLPVPEFTIIEQEYVAPETEQEHILCSVLENLFQMERIGITDDFFELGGDSLRAIEYVAKAHNEGITFALQNVFDYPTVQQLCAFMNSNSRVKVIYSEEDFLKYQPLLDKNVIDSKYIPVKKTMGNVFLTGATGFLGSHIIDQFMKEETGKIYCLVRGSKERLASTLEYYFADTYTADIGKRIIAVEGDITRSDLSDHLPGDIQTVIHTAATVKHYGSYDYFHGVNVQGTKNVLAYAEKMGAKMIHISTLSVSGNSMVDAFDVYYAEETMEFSEQSLYIGQPLDNVYIHSKFEAERTVLDAALAGLDIKIIRVGNLTNRAFDFKFQPNYQTNAFLNRVKAVLELGCLPDYLLPIYAEFSPVDQTAEGIIKIVQYAGNQSVFHLNNNRNLYFDRMVEVMRALGINMDVVDGNHFSGILENLAKDPSFAYIYEALQNDMDETGKLVYDTNIRILNDFTVWFMEKVGFIWTKIDFDYIRGYIDYFRNLGYLEV